MTNKELRKRIIDRMNFLPIISKSKDEYTSGIKELSWILDNLAPDEPENNYQRAANEIYAYGVKWNLDKQDILKSYMSVKDEWDYERDMPKQFYISYNDEDSFPGLGFKTFIIRCPFKLYIGDELTCTHNRSTILTVVMDSDDPETYIVLLSTIDRNEFFPSEMCIYPWILSVKVTKPESKLPVEECKERVEQLSLLDRLKDYQMEFNKKLADSNNIPYNPKPFSIQEFEDFCATWFHRESEAKKSREDSIEELKRQNDCSLVVTEPEPVIMASLSAKPPEKSWKDYINEFRNKPVEESQVPNESIYMANFSSKHPYESWSEFFKRHNPVVATCSLNTKEPKCECGPSYYPFTSESKFTIQGRGDVYVVKANTSFTRKELLGALVMIDGKKYKVGGVETWGGREAIAEGDSMGLLVSEELGKL